MGRTSTNGYYKVDPKKASPEEVGKGFGEFIWNGHDYTLHFASGEDSRLLPPDSHSLSVEGISLSGWRRLQRDIGDADYGDRMAVAQKIVQLPYITWNRPFINRELID